MFFLHCWHNESVMNDQTKLAKSALLMAVRVSLVLSRTVERRGRGFRTLNRFKLYYSLPGMGLLQNTVTWYKKTPCRMASTQWEREKKGYMLFEWCNLFVFLTLCVVCHSARCYFLYHASVQRANFRAQTRVCHACQSGAWESRNSAQSLRIWCLLPQLFVALLLICDEKIEKL